MLQTGFKAQCFHGRKRVRLRAGPSSSCKRVTRRKPTSRRRSALSRALAVSLKNGAAFPFAAHRAGTGATLRCTLPGKAFFVFRRPIRPYSSICQ